DDLLVDDPDVAAGNRAHRELLAPWDAQLSDQHRVERRRERRGDLEADRDPAPRQPEDDHVVAASVALELAGQAPPCLAPVAESPYLGAVGGASHPLAARRLALGRVLDLLGWGRRLGILARLGATLARVPVILLRRVAANATRLVGERLLRLGSVHRRRLTRPLPERTLTRLRRAAAGAARAGGRADRGGRTARRCPGASAGSAPGGAGGGRRAGRRRPRRRAVAQAGSSRARARASTFRWRPGAGPSGRPRRGIRAPTDARRAGPRAARARGRARRAAPPRTSSRRRCAGGRRLRRRGPGAARPQPARRETHEGRRRCNRRSARASPSPSPAGRPRTERLAASP